MESIKIHLKDVCSIFGNVTDLFSGSFSYDNNELKRMKHELKNEGIPTISDDRKNLKIDSDNVVLDYKKAVDVKKSEVSQY